MSEPICVEEWLAELERLETDAQTNSLDAYTGPELCRRFGRGTIWTRALLREAIQQGLVRVVRKRIVDMGGRTTTVPAYQLVRPEKPKKRK